MENKIHLLKPDEAAKIAAGEVIENLANIAKEILENAVDANATTITVDIIQNNQDNQIRVQDDGEGMSENDARMCLLPHATSKIKSFEDMLSVSTFGFRGEALASIAAVSDIRIATKSRYKKDEELGTLIESQATKPLRVTKIAQNHGTEIKISHLFDTVPARKKFLKKPETEWNKILLRFQAIALVNNNIHFRLSRNGTTVHNLPATDTQKERIIQLWGHNAGQNLLQIKTPHELSEKFEKNGIGLSGFISNQHFWRYTKNSLFFFINKRWVKNTELTRSLIKGYLGSLPDKRFPMAFIFLSIDKSKIDINVHPKKEEIRLEHPKRISLALQKSVQHTLQEQLTEKLQLSKKIDTNINSEQSAQPPISEKSGTNTLTPSYDPSIPRFENTPASLFQSLASSMPFTDLTSAVSTTNSEMPSTADNRSIVHNPSITYNKEVNADHNTITTKNVIKENNADNFGESAQKKISENKTAVVGQVLKTYILIEKEDELIIIDQHAAHERILYEKFTKLFTRREGITLIFPITLPCPAEIAATLKKNQKIFEQHGVIFTTEPDKNTMTIVATPPCIESTDLKDFIMEVISVIETCEAINEDQVRKAIHEHIHSHMACKMAIRSGDLLSKNDMEQIVQDLSNTEKPLICVHGRPTTWNISKKTLDKTFQRTK